MGTRIRFTVLISLFGLAYAGLVFHLYNLQITNGDVYVARAGSQIMANRMLSAERGGIYFLDKNNNRMAVVANKQFPLVYAVPTEIGDAKETANQVGPLLGLNIDPLIKQLDRPKDQYELLKKKVPDKEATEVQTAGIKGIYVENVPERYYPFGDLAAQMLGFVAPNSTDKGESGRYGVEEFYNDRLLGEPGEMDGSKVVAPKPGEDVILTIDPNIQIESQRILENVVKAWNAKGGSVVVEDPKTGKILAMESYPSFDPNNYSKAEIGDFINPVTQEVYEPGSVFKVLTMSAGIDAGKITPDTTFVDPGILELNGKKIRNWDLKAHGEEKVPQTHSALGTTRRGAPCEARLVQGRHRERPSADPGRRTGFVQGPQREGDHIATAG